MEYDLEVEKVISVIKKENAKVVLLQLADGLKKGSKELVDEIEKKTNAKVWIWLGQCFGGCDIPINMRNKVDLCFQFGHNMFIKNPLGWK